MWQPSVSRARSNLRRPRDIRARRTSLERLEERQLLSYADFELSSLLPANGGDGSKGFVVSGTTSYSELGGPHESLPVGDINQDGIDDLLVAAPSDVAASGYPLPQEYLIFGTRSGFPAEFNLSTLNGTAGYVIDGVAVGDHTGVYGGAGGDVNHDGISDLILGAAPVDGVRAGQSYVIFGGSSNLTALDSADGSPDGRIKLTSLDGANGFTINGTAYGDGAGRITAAGDVNDDGVDDLLIGGINAFNRNGGAFVVFGRDSTHGASFPSVVQLSSLDGTNGFAIPGSGGAFGSGVAGVGDINGDGIADIVVGAMWADPAARTDAGQAFAIFGRATFPATFDVSSLNGSNGFTMNGAVAKESLGGSISPAGDFNGDGIADVLIGAGLQGPGINGGAYVVYGKNTALSGQFPATFDGTWLDGTSGLAVQGFAGAGTPVHAAGDVDGDGFADILISASASNGQDFLVFGGPGLGASIPLAGLLAAKGGDGSSGVAFNGIPGGGASLKAAGIGDINGDGSPDMRFGSTYVPVNGNPWAGQAYIVFGKPTAPGIRVTPTLGLAISESGGSAVFNVVLRTAPTSNVTIPVSSSDTTEGTVSISSLTFTPANWRVPQTVTITGVDDSLTDGDIAYPIVLGAATSADPAYNGLNPADVSVTNLDNDTKFYAVNDDSTDRTYEYTASGGAVENYALNGGNSAPRGAASTAAGDKVWVVDNNKKVYVYNPGGTLLGSWTAGSLAGNATVEGIATNGTDIWIVDSKQAKVFRYTGAASRLSGSQNAASNFSLNSSNASPKDVVTDGTNLWVVNDSSTDKVFKYNLSGTLLGSWTISGAGSSPTGITLDPSGGGTLWIVDTGSDRVYQFDNARGLTSGSQSPSTSFALAAGNTNPQGIADPPVGLRLPVVNTTRVEGYVSRPRFLASLSPRYLSPAAFPHDPGRQLGLGPDVGVSAQLDPSVAALPTTQLAIGLSKRIRPTQRFPTYVGLD